MSIYFWTKEVAILITKTTRYVLPAVIAAVGAVGGYITAKVTGRKNKKEKQK